MNVVRAQPFWNEGDNCLFCELSAILGNEVNSVLRVTTACAVVEPWPTGSERVTQCLCLLIIVRSRSKVD